MSFLLRALFVLLAVSPLSGQIHGLVVAEKVAKKHSKLLVDYQGERMILVEIKKGPPLENNTFMIQPTMRYEFWIGDPSDPTKLPYKVKKGQRDGRSKKSILAISGEDLKGLRMVMPTESFVSLAQEFEHREDAILSFKKQRDGFKRGDKEWFAAHQLMCRNLERLASWLRSCGYEQAAIKQDKELQRQLKVVSKDARADRLKRALASITKVETPQELVDVAYEITDGQTTFGVRESEHFRIVFTDSHSGPRIEGVLELAELALEGFRSAHVDVYEGTGFDDRIPDQVLQEYFFGPAGPSDYAKFYEQYYKQDWGPRKSERIKMKGTAVTLGRKQGRLEYWRTSPNSPLEGIVLHRLGHVLAEIHYLNPIGEVSHDWLGEAVGYALSFEHLGRNDVVCVAFEDPESKYARAKKEGKAREIPEIMGGFRDYFQDLALQNNQPFDVLFGLD
ncbi:MAG: hypothetical protein MK213_02560, partial [Planctomycetes bacterium]|nr:hypothetical protein [Planctomycetota bacterium]